jgi:transposase-like protein
MILQVLHCPHCHGTDIVRHGQTRQGKQRYRCREQRCAGRTFLLDYSYPGQSPAVKEQIVEMALNASGIRDTARVLHISTNTVMTELKKTRVAKSAGVSSSQASRDMILDHGESADAGFVADGESPVPAVALARP